MLTVYNKKNGKPQSLLVARWNRLDSWKQIAVYLDRQVRTVQRWEKCEGLPVHRQFHVKAGTVCAFKHEIDSWLENRCRPIPKPVQEEKRTDEFVHWSSPIELIARSGGDRCWLWLVVNTGSPRHHSDPQVVPINGMVGVRKIRATNLCSSVRPTDGKL
jgi:hypothetical protein